MGKRKSKLGYRGKKRKAASNIKPVQVENCNFERITSTRKDRGSIRTGHQNDSTEIQDFKNDADSDANDVILSNFVQVELDDDGNDVPEVKEVESIEKIFNDTEIFRVDAFVRQSFKSHYQVETVAIPNDSVDHFVRHEIDEVVIPTDEVDAFVRQGFESHYQSEKVPIQTESVDAFVRQDIESIAIPVDDVKEDFSVRRTNFDQILFPIKTAINIWLKIRLQLRL